MPRNYNSLVAGVPYIRVTELSLSYDQQQRALVGYTDQRAITTTGGAVEHLAGPDAQRRGSFAVEPSQWGVTIPRVVNPTTGATNGTMTLGEAQLAILSVLRWDQLAWDASQEPPAPPEQPE
jgi:hypothetical protein